MITSKNKLHSLIQEWGFLPFFKHRVEGFSIEEHTPEELWFTDDRLAMPWEWKGPVITDQWDCVYGKFFRGKAGFVSLEWWADFANWRRSLCPRESLPEEARHIMEVLEKNESMLSRELKKACGFSLARKKKYNMFGEEDTEANRHNGATFDRIINDMQMNCHVVTADFEYNYSRSGERYGWGVARYCTPEALYGEDAMHCERTPEESRQRILCHLASLFPHTNPKELEKLI